MKIVKIRTTQSSTEYNRKERKMKKTRRKLVEMNEDSAEYRKKIKRRGHTVHLPSYIPYRPHIIVDIIHMISLAATDPRYV